MVAGFFIIYKNQYKPLTFIESVLNRLKMCVKPITLKLPDGRMQDVPCSKCPLCVKKKISQWQFRLKKELEISTSAYFVTLTYNDENLQYGQDEPTLVKRDFQLFMKKLRKREKTKLRYYAVGEYGTKSQRPHYHAIIYNIENPENIQLAWDKGFVYSPPLTSVKGIGYTLKYISKPRNKITGKEPEFSLMSKGIGANYLTPQMKKYHSQLNNCYITDDGYRKSMPKYYKDKLYTDDQRKIVTKHLQQRSQDVENQAFAKLRKKHPLKDVNYLLNILERRKYLLTFDKRNEVL